MVVANGQKMTIREPNRVVSAPVVVTAAVLQRLTVPEVVRMVLQQQRQQMVMGPHQIWVHYPLHPAVFSIPHQVSIARQQILFSIFKWFLI